MHAVRHGYFLLLVEELGFGDFIGEVLECLDSLEVSFELDVLFGCLWSVGGWRADGWLNRHWSECSWFLWNWNGLRHNGLVFWLFYWLFCWLFYWLFYWLPDYFLFLLT